jgi:leader peptidase (prepilin peptidase)/N-methyltransferase
LIAPDTADSPDTADDVQPNWALVLAGTAAVALLSAATLPWTLALTSTALAALMVAGADLDARTQLLPDTMTLATLACGLGAAVVLDPLSPWQALLDGSIRGAATAGILAGLRFAYWKARGTEGLGLGDVKLAAGIGVWLPLEHIPICFALATGAALLYAVVASRRGVELGRGTRLPFGAFLCPALWFVFYAGVVSG